MKSCATWGAVGHCLGLGDRHGENILVDMDSGGCVHVDFDCLFDKGCALKEPEIVPFRLTPHMVEAFGTAGHADHIRALPMDAMTKRYESGELAATIV